MDNLHIFLGASVADAAARPLHWVYDPKKLKKYIKIVDTIVDEKEKVVKLIAEMPGVEKTDVKILFDKNVVNITAEHDEKKYHCTVPLQHKVDENSGKATYKNGILQLVFKLVVEKQTSKKVEVE